MSCYEWEAGTIKLPTTEFARVRKAIQDADTKHREAMFGHAQGVWKGLTRKEQTDPAEYRRAVNAAIDAKIRAAEAPTMYGSRFSPPSGIPNNAQAVLEGAQSRMQLVAYRGGPPRRILKSDMNFPNNRSTEFHHSDCSISFDRENSTVRWDVGENNHAVERARATHLAAALFDTLGDVKWTRGTGGTFTGNNEYHREDSGYGGGANYYTDAFGPVGAEEAPDKCRPYTDSKGKRVARADLDNMRQEKFQREMNFQRKMAGTQGRVSKGIKEGGQFTQGRRGESGVRLR